MTDPSTCMVSVNTPSAFQSSKKSVSACTLYHDKGPEPLLRKTSPNAWLFEAIDGADGGAHDQGDIYCVICYETGALEIFDVPNFNSVFIVDKFVSGKIHVDLTKGMNEEVAGAGRKESTQNMKILSFCFFGILTYGTILCYHACLFEGPDGNSKLEDPVSARNSVGDSSISAFAVQRPVNQVLSSMADQEFGHQIENPNLSSVEIHQTDSADEFEVRIL
ncbi:hypothetical protein Peur_068989 [Populus x canadensis]